MTTILNVIFVLGLAAVAVGVGMIYLPAGVIVAGALAAAASLLLVIGSQRPEAPSSDR